MYRTSTAIRATVRHLTMASNTPRSGLVLGAFKNAEKEHPVSEDQLTAAAKAFNKKTGGKLLEHINCAKPLGGGDCRIFYGLDDKYKVVSVVEVGERGVKENHTEQWHEGKENVRKASCAGALALRKLGVLDVEIDGCGYPDAAAEGSILGLFTYDEEKKEDAREKPVAVSLTSLSEEGGGKKEWEEGRILAEGQNVARRLMEMPMNILSPTRFAEIAAQLFKDAPNVTVTPRNKEWAESQKMHSYLSVAKGSDRPPVFLEIHIKPGQPSDKQPIVVVGKGVCFDSGGISLKPGLNMDKMRADMGGAACTLAAGYTVSRLMGESMKRELILLMPMVDNMPSGHASCPGDIVKARNGKSIKIDNTDAEGRLILADALCYADDFKPDTVVDLATLTGAIMVALGGACSAVFSTTHSLWEGIHKASVDTGDRVWRMPLFKHYSNKMKDDYADLNNLGKPGSGGGSCTAAAFLKEFTECKSWAHLDIASVMEGDAEVPYVPKGMSGRPTRTLVRWLTAQLS